MDRSGKVAMDKKGAATDTAFWSSQARIDAPSTGHDEDPWAGFTCPGGVAGFKSRANFNEFKGSRIAAAGLRRLPVCARISRARKGGHTMSRLSRRTFITGVAAAV